MLNNKGFMLYDALLSFILLISMSSFFLLCININLNKTKEYETRISAIESLREEVYNYQVNGYYTSKTYDDYYLQLEGDGICAYFYEVKYGKECV